MGCSPLPLTTSEDRHARLAIVLLLVLILLTGCGADQTGPATTSSAAIVNSATEPPSPRIAAAGGAIARVSLTELPDEALETITLIQAGGPFPFERDGITFGNYEARLPAAPFGDYREYTVITPGLDHRGARRIVAGNEGDELYYTDDHYQSFREVVLPDD